MYLGSFGGLKDFSSMFTNESLVGRNDMLSFCYGGQGKFSSGINAAHQFANQVDFRIIYDFPRVRGKFL